MKLAAVALMFLAARLVAQAPAERVITIEDLIKDHEFGPLVPQPSGNWVAIVTHPNWSGYEPVFGSQLALVSRADGARFPIGEREFDRHWIENVLWSPDGSQLVIVSRTLSNGDSHLYVWNTRGRTLRRLSIAPLGYRLSAGASPLAEAAWASDSALLYVELPDSVLATADKSPENHFRFIAPKMWNRLAEGREPTAHAVESGVVDSTGGGHAVFATLVSVNPRTGARRVLGTTTVPARYRQLYFFVAPHQRSAIVRVWDKPQPRRGVAIDINRMWREYVGTLELRAGAAIRWFAHELNPASTIAWSRDGSSATVTGSRYGSSERVQWTVDGSSLRVDRRTTIDSSRAGVDKRPESVRLPGGARVAVDHPDQRLTTFTLLTDSGSFAHALNWESGRVTPLMAINRYIAGIKYGRRILIDYRGNDGEPLKGVALLPPNYKEGRRYPVLTWVYAENVYRTAQLSQYLAAERGGSSANLQVVAARDYVVLFPSIPMPPDTLKRDQLLEIRGPVLAAVDRLIEMGIADPARIAVAGHSNGGYTTNVLVTQTNRFKAAISMAGMSNLTSVAGTFDPRFRYTDMAARDGTIQMYWAESGQAELKGSVQDNLWAYLRNSPVFWADRIQTPMLFLHGDQDFVALSEAEQLFTALYRQGKRARLLRFWGEGHLIGASPANVRRKWEEIFGWLDEHCDIVRDADGTMIFEGNRPKSRASISR
jgi:dipeptidyl aminopeptidase/acylaminoacyl peptidase